MSPETFFFVAPPSMNLPQMVQLRLPHLLPP